MKPCSEVGSYRSTATSEFVVPCISYCNLEDKSQDLVCAGGVTEYQTQCVAGCHNASDITVGPCPVADAAARAYSDCFCDHSVFEPVCGYHGDDAGEYANMCVAQCDGATGITKGACPEPAARNGGTPICTPPALTSKVISDPQSSGGACPAVWVVRYTATDACGNSISKNVRFTMPDTTPPAIVSQCQSGYSECDGSYDSANTGFNNWLQSGGGAIFNDGVDGSSLIYSHSAPNFVGSDPGGISAYNGAVCANSQSIVTFYATDHCGNTAQSVGMYEVRDTKPPVITRQALPLQLPLEDRQQALTIIEGWLSDHGGARAFDLGAHKGHGCTDGISRVTEGPGPFECDLCTKTYSPVCGTTSATTYDNSCDARCHGEFTFTDGVCTDVATSSTCASCSTDSDPVCANGTEYGNPCLANCRGVHAYVEGACPKRNDEFNSCNCQTDYHPVCKDEKEYTNMCFMMCAANAAVPTEQFTTGICSAAFKNTFSCFANVVWSASKNAQQIYQELASQTSCSRTAPVRFSVADGCGNTATTEAQATGHPGKPIISKPPNPLVLTCDARCGNQDEAVRNQLHDWLRSAGCAEIAGGGGTWTADRSINDLGSLCGSSGQVTFTVTNGCGGTTNVVGSYSINHFTSSGCDVCGELPDDFHTGTGTGGTGTLPCDTCENGKLQTLTLEFAGQNGGSNSQPSDKYFVNGDPGAFFIQPGTVVSITNSMNSQVANVVIGQTFTLSTFDGNFRFFNDTEPDYGFVPDEGEARTEEESDRHSQSGSGGKFPAQLDLFLTVGGQQVSHISFHSSCSYPMLMGEQFGSLIIRGFTNTGGVNQNSCTPYTASSSGGGTSMGSTGRGSSKPKLKRVTLRWHAANPASTVSVSVSGKNDQIIYADANLNAVADQQVITLSVSQLSFRVFEEGVESNFRLDEQVPESERVEDGTAADRSHQYGSSSGEKFPSEVYIYVNGVYYFAHVSCSVPIILGERWAESQYGYFQLIQFERTDGKTGNNCYGGAEPSCQDAHSATYSCSETHPPSLPPTKYPTRYPTKDPTHVVYVQPDITEPPTRMPTTRAPINPPPPSSSGCVNRRDDVVCQEWVGFGYCAPSSQYYTYMELYCAKQCGMCSAYKDPETTTQSPTKTPTEMAGDPYQCTSLDVCSTGSRPTTMTLMYVPCSPPPKLLALDFSSRTPSGIVIS